MIAILLEAYNHYRQIFLDSRPLPEASQPAYMGYSVGKWDNDTLVVETTGSNDRGRLDTVASPNRIVTRDGTLPAHQLRAHSLQLTIDDARAYTKPWTVNLSGFNFL